MVKNKLDVIDDGEMSATHQLLEKDANKAMSKERRSYPVNEFGPLEIAGLISVVVVFLILTIFFNVFLGIISIPLVLLLSSIRIVPPIHNVLLYWSGRCLEVGHTAGPYFNFWFFGVKTQLFDLHQLSHEIIKQDCFAKSVNNQRMKMTYKDVVILFGVKPVEEEGFWKNLVRFFKKRTKNGACLFRYAQVEDMDMAFANLQAIALSSISIAVRRHYWYELLAGTGFDGEAGTPIDMEALQAEVLEIMNRQAEKFGMKVYLVTIGDLDVHEDLRKKIEAPVVALLEAKGRQAAYVVLREIAEHLNAGGSAVRDTALNIEKLRVLDNGGGTVDQFFRAIVSGKMDELVKNPEQVLVAS